MRLSKKESAIRRKLFTEMHWDKANQRKADEYVAKTKATYREMYVLLRRSGWVITLMMEGSMGIATSGAAIANSFYRGIVNAIGRII